MGEVVAGPGGGSRARPDEPYAQDLYAWALDQAARMRGLARAEVPEGIDAANVARELEAVAEARRREVLHWIGQLMGDLMRVQYSSPERASTTSDAMGIAAARSALRRLMTPSLMPLMARELAATYDRLRLTLAATLAEAEGPKAARRMPAVCPYTLERILDHHWYPQALRKPYR